MSVSDNEFPASATFDLIQGALSSDPALLKKTIKATNAVIVFKLTNKDKKTQAWTLDLKSTGKVVRGDDQKADVTLTLTDENFGNLVIGKANAQKLFMSGKLKVAGNVMKATAVEQVLKSAKAKL